MLTSSIDDQLEAYVSQNEQWWRKVENLEGGGVVHINNIFVFTDLENNRFEKKLVMQNRNNIRYQYSYNIHILYEYDNIFIII
jgi:hypothetical protein